MLAHLALLTGALTLFACGGLVVFDPDEDEGDGGASTSPGPGPTSNSSSSGTGTVSAVEAYCTALDASEALHSDCSDGLDLDECLASEQCAMGMLRPDTGPILLDCLGKEGCYGVPNECLLELTSFGLTPAGQAFYDECTLNGECPDAAYCMMAYWLNDEALTSAATCVDGFQCGLSPVSCLEDSTLWQCNGWLRKVNAWYF